VSPSVNRGVHLLGVAAGLLAATLPAFGCGDPVDEASIPAATRNAAADRPTQGLPSRWLIPPQPSLEPPLAAPVAIDVDIARGRLYLLELQPPEVRVYDLADGSLVEELGGEGDGPGEYRFPVDLAVNSSGTAAVLLMNGRVVYWRPDGTLAGEVRVGTGLATDLLAAVGDTFYVKSDLFPPHDESEFRIVTPDTALAKARFSDDGIASLEEPASLTKNHSYAVAGTPTGDVLLSPLGPDYLIHRMGPDGELRQTISRPEVQPLVRSEDEAEAVREKVRRGFAAAGRGVPGSLRVPLYRPHISRLAASPDGSIWALTGRGDDSTAIIDHFTPDGEFASSYSVALNVGDLAVGERSIYLLARGALDVAGVAVVPRPHFTSERAATR